MKPTLLILAAGMGSRYGGLKQLDALGPNGETIMDYSVYDAIDAGFGKIVFVIRKHFEDDFRKNILSKYESRIVVEVVFQEIENVPLGCTYHPDREKPWGTNHAIMMAQNIIKEPFAVINADDFYGRTSYSVLANFLQSVSGKQNTYCMVGYHLGNTLSENGTVSRGECHVNADGFLTSVTERTKIASIDGKIQYQDGQQSIILSEETPVSMNMWGFTPDYFDYSKEAFITFLNNHGQELKSEFYIPTMVNDLIISKQVTCTVLDTPEKWFGVTYAEDRAHVVEKINQLIKDGVYPEKLWK